MSSLHRSESAPAILQNRETIRKYCYRCFKPAVVCICNTIAPVKNRTHIRILQHPLERHHPIGTARFAELGLENVDLKTVYASLSGSLVTESNCPPGTGLLFPADDAMDLASVTAENRPVALIVLDGTWYNAKKLYKENPWLHTLPHYRLNPSSPSRYRIRLEPTSDSISTLEAIVAALNILEPQTDTTSLLTAFDAMIDRQIAFMASGDGTPRRKRPRHRQKRCIPVHLTRNFDNVVVVYGENIRLDSNADTPTGSHRRIPVSLCALRLGDGETFERFVTLPSHLSHRLEELTPSGILGRHTKEAISTAALLNDWQQFLRADDVLCSWNKGTLQSIFQIPGFPRAPYFFLKAAYGNTVKEKFGTLEEVIAQLAITPPRSPFSGRAGTRISNAIAMAEYLHAIGTDAA